jgi:hypothetical protein
MIAKMALKMLKTKHVGQVSDRNLFCQLLCYDLNVSCDDIGRTSEATKKIDTGAHNEYKIKL